MRTTEWIGNVGGVNYMSYRNGGAGETYGAEMSASWRVVDRWRLTASYTALQVQLHVKPGVQDPSFEVVEGYTPENQFQIHSYLDLPAHFEFDQGLYYVDNLPGQNVQNYLRYDIGLGWRPKKWFEARLSFQNLLNASHREFGGANAVVDRSVFGQIRIRF